MTQTYEFNMGQALRGIATQPPGMTDDARRLLASLAMTALGLTAQDVTLDEFIQSLVDLDARGYLQAMVELHGDAPLQRVTVVDP